jgi:selenocysteine-specific translation elongation factor
MRNLTVFAYGLSDFIRDLAKKGTESDVTIYSRKDSEDITTFMVPSRFPEKISSLTDCIYPSDYALVSGDTINRDLGEVIMALDLAGVKRGTFIVKDSESEDRIRQIISRTGLRDYRFHTGSAMEFLDTLLQEKPVERFKTTTVVIDHFFKVKSVGTVALGFVLGGTVKKHQKLHCSFTDAEIQVRSIQVQDVDMEEASTGSRVGLALKNIDTEEMERGMFLTEEPQKSVGEIRAEFQPYPSLKTKWNSGEIFIADQMRYQRGFYESGELKLDRGMPLFRRELIAVSPNSTPRLQGLFRVA